MAKKPEDPTEIMRAFAGQFPDVSEGISCTQASFKIAKKSFFFAGPQGGRFKAMFKLDTSMEEAKKLAGSKPDDYNVGSNGWVTARFSSEKPMAKTRWKKWIKESYGLCTIPKKSRS